jgi:hypothetical protein
LLFCPGSLFIPEISGLMLSSGFFSIFFSVFFSDFSFELLRLDFFDLDLLDLDFLSELFLFLSLDYKIIKSNIYLRMLFHIFQKQTKYILKKNKK